MKADINWMHCIKQSHIGSSQIARSTYWLQTITIPIMTDGFGKQLWQRFFSQFYLEFWGRPWYPVVMDRGWNVDEDNRKWMWVKLFWLLYQLCVPSTKSQPISLQTKTKKRSRSGNFNVSTMRSHCVPNKSFLRCPTQLCVDLMMVEYLYWVEWLNSCWWSSWS